MTTAEPSAWGSDPPVHLDVMQALRCCQQLRRLQNHADTASLTDGKDSCNSVLDLYMFCHAGALGHICFSTCSAMQALWDTFASVQSSLPTTAAAGIASALFVAKRLGRMPGVLQPLSANLLGWTATLLFMFQPLAQLVRLWNKADLMQIVHLVIHAAHPVIHAANWREHT